MRVAYSTASDASRLHTLKQTGRHAKRHAAMLNQFAPHPVVGWLHLIIKCLLHALIPFPYREFVWIATYRFHSLHYSYLRVHIMRIRIATYHHFIRLHIVVPLNRTSLDSILCVKVASIYVCAIKFIMLNYTWFKLFLIIPVDHYS